MSKKKYIVDTNVPIIANMAGRPSKIPSELNCCVLSCIEIIDYITQNGGLVLDSDDEVFFEYKRYLSFKGQPGLGDYFFRWINDNRANSNIIENIKLTKEDDNYAEFPNDSRLNSVDVSDRKFIALSNIHAEKPPILQAVDSKWWGWKEALKNHGINIIFLCPKYIEEKYNKKIGA